MSHFHSFNQICQYHVVFRKTLRYGAVLIPYTEISPDQIKRKQTNIVIKNLKKMKRRLTAKFFKTTLTDTDTKANGHFRAHRLEAHTCNQPPSPVILLGVGGPDCSDRLVAIFAIIFQ
jgi:hypothetical protein